MDVEDIKKNKKYFIIGLVILVIFVFSISFAYFLYNANPGEGSDIRIQTETTNELIFTKGTDITLLANISNFDITKGNLSAESISNVTYNASVSSIETYDVKINIYSNNYQYTSVANDPEVILTITDPENNVISSLGDLSLVTVQDRITNETITGFDVTEKTGEYLIAENYPIEILTNDTASQNWKVKVTFVNLDADQTANEGKSFTSSFVLEK